MTKAIINSLFTILIILILLLFGCSNSDNPVSVNNSLQGIWNLNYAGNTDTLNVTLSLNGKNNNINGDGKLEYVKYNYLPPPQRGFSGKQELNYQGINNISGSYSDTTLNIIFKTFFFTGNKIDTYYKGKAILINDSPTLDTLLIINNAIFVKQ